MQHHGETSCSNKAGGGSVWLTASVREYACDGNSLCVCFCVLCPLLIRYWLNWHVQVVCKTSVCASPQMCVCVDLEIRRTCSKILHQGPSLLENPTERCHVEVSLINIKGFDVFSNGLLVPSQFYNDFKNVMKGSRYFSMRQEDKL